MRNWITPGAALLCSICLLVSGWGLYSFLAGADQRRAQNARAWHAVICYLEAQVVASHRASAAQKARAVRVYDHILVLVHAEPC